MMYYGVTMHAGNMGGDFYLNFFLLAVVEFPAYSLSIFLLDRIGRKKLHCSFMVVGGLACLSTIFPVLYGDKCKECVLYALKIKTYDSYVILLKWNSLLNINKTCGVSLM